MINKYRPDCYKMECRHLADIILRLPIFGPVYFCAGHGLPNLRMAVDALVPING